MMSSVRNSTKYLKDGLTLSLSSPQLRFDWQSKAKSRISRAWWCLSQKLRCHICWVLGFQESLLRVFNSTGPSNLRQISCAPLLTTDTNVCAAYFYAAVSAEAASTLKPGCWQLQQHKAEPRLQTPSSKQGKWPCQEESHVPVLCCNLQGGCHLDMLCSQTKGKVLLEGQVTQVPWGNRTKAALLKQVSHHHHEVPGCSLSQFPSFFLIPLHTVYSIISFTSSFHLSQSLEVLVSTGQGWVNTCLQGPQGVVPGGCGWSIVHCWWSAPWALFSQITKVFPHHSTTSALLPMHYCFSLPSADGT